MKSSIISSLRLFASLVMVSNVEASLQDSGDARIPNYIIKPKYLQKEPASHNFEDTNHLFINQNDFKNFQQHIECFDAISEGQMPNLICLEIIFHAEANFSEVIKKLTLAIQNKNFSQLETLLLYTDNLTQKQIDDLKQLLLNSRFPALKYLSFEDASIDFVESVVKIKECNFPLLAEFNVSFGIIDDMMEYREKIAKEKGLVISGIAEFADLSQKEYQAYLKQKQKLFELACPLKCG